MIGGDGARASLGGEEHLDAAHDAWLAADVTEALQREDHLVHGRRVTRVGLIGAIIAVPLAGTRSPYHPHQLASVTQVFQYGVVPQVRVAFADIAIYTWDVAFRAATPRFYDRSLDARA